jgi:hypothetical protein
MANEKALVIVAGVVKQIPDVDTLIVGAGITSVASSALTITANAASTWSTSSGLLTIQGAGGITLNGSAAALVINTAGTAITVQAGATLATTSTGNINLPNNGSARFQIEGSSVSANVTATNLGTLTAGSSSNADALHTHAGLASVAGYVTGENVAGTALVCFQDNSGTPNVYEADSDGTGQRPNAAGFNSSTSTVTSGNSITVAVSGEVAVNAAQFDSAPAVTDVGKFVFMSTTQGKITLTAPSSSGQVVQIVGIVTNGSGSPKVLIHFGQPILL